MTSVARQTGLAAAALLAALLLSGCSQEGGEYEPMDFEGYVDGKEDTGYVSNKAAELEAKLTSRVYIDMAGETPAEIQALADSLAAASRWTLQDYTTPQIKFARNPLKSEKLDLNLEMGEPQILEVQTDEGGVWLSYSLAIESLVKFKELQDKGLTPTDLVGKTISFLLPSVPAQAFTKGGIPCAADPDGAALEPSEVTEENYFYYFSPSKAGCPMRDGVDLVAATYEIISSLDTTSVYPEYDLLTADRKITMVALFGQITHGELTAGDSGWSAYRSFLGKLKRLGFATSQTFPDSTGEQIKKTYPGSLEVVVDLYAPEALKDTRDRSEVNQLFADVIKSHEVVYYNGHSFYGSLSVLDNRDAYPVDTYQIIFMDSCWSYAYYTKQVFASKSGPSDPDGMKYADVVNNTEPGITGSEETAYLLYKNLFEGASKLMQNTPPVKYSWNNMTVYMNESADARARWYDPAEFHAEIYGASGVSRNCFNPSGPSFCTTTPVDPQTRTYEDTSGEAAIPDNAAAGVSKTISVPDAFTVQGASVSMEISHTYIGDLTVTLSHGGRDVVLLSRAGGGTDDLRTTFQPADFNGMDASGAWTLKVADLAAYDTGSLKKWSLVFNSGSVGPTPVRVENTQQQPIPDNQQAGITSIISVTDSVSISQLTVHVKVTHTYIGDLVVILKHGGVEAVLMNREGGSAENIDRDFFPAQWSGQSAAGEWSLTVADRAASDAGTLDSWSLTVTPQ